MSRRAVAGSELEPIRKIDDLGLSERNLLIRGNELSASLVLPDDNSAR
jgi:hypothetical protein